MISIASIIASVCVGYSVNIPTPNDRESYRVCSDISYSAIHFNSILGSKIFIMHDKTLAASASLDFGCVPMPQWVSMAEVVSLCQKDKNSNCAFVLAEGYGFPVHYASRYIEDMRPGLRPAHGTVGSWFVGIDPSSWIGGFPVVICWRLAWAVFVVHVIIIELCTFCVITFRRRRRLRKGLCWKCGYILGCFSRCPECGSCCNGNR